MTDAIEKLRKFVNREQSEPAPSFNDAECRQLLRAIDAPLPPAEPVEREGEAWLGRTFEVGGWKFTIADLLTHVTVASLHRFDTYLAEAWPIIVEALRSRPASHQQAVPAGAVDELEALMLKRIAALRIEVDGFGLGGITRRRRADEALKRDDEMQREFDARKGTP